MKLGLVSHVYQSGDTILANIDTGSETEILPILTGGISVSAFEQVKKSWANSPMRFTESKKWIRCEWPKGVYGLPEQDPFPSVPVKSIHWYESSYHWDWGTYRGQCHCANCRPKTIVASAPAAAVKAKPTTTTTSDSTKALLDRLAEEAIGRKYKPVNVEIHLPPDCCIFCFKHKSKDNSETGCQYGMRHEYPEKKEKPTVEVKEAARKPPHKDVCLACGCHRKNPLSATNDCNHVYPQ
jgi:hypothetical protein